MLLSNRRTRVQDFNFALALKPRRLESHEVVSYGDIVEDVQAGDNSRVEKGSFYGSLVGLTAAQVKQLPQVNEVIREEIDFADD